MIKPEEASTSAETKSSVTARSRRAVARYVAVLLIAVLALLIFSYFASNRDAQAQEDALQRYEQFEMI